MARDRDSVRGSRRTGAILAAIVVIVFAGLIVWWIVADESQVLVVTDPQQQQLGNLQEGQTVQVVGTVRRFSLDEFDGLGDQGLFEDFEGTPAIVARTIRPVGGDGGDSDLIEQIADEDTVLVGRRVTVTGEVAERVGVATFVLEDD